MASTLPSAKELMAKAAEKEAQKAAEAMRLQAKADAEKKALIERLQQPSGLSDEEALRSVKMIIERAVNNGFTQVQVYRFSNSLCTDRAPAINQQEADFASTLLKGLPREMYLGAPAKAARIQAAIPHRRFSERSSGVTSESR